MNQQVPQSGGAIENGAMDNLVAALFAELANELPDDVRMEGVRADLLAASRSYGQGKQQELALRFYLAFRSMLHEFQLLRQTQQQPYQASNPAPDPSYSSPAMAGTVTYTANQY